MKQSKIIDTSETYQLPTNLDSKERTVGVKDGAIPVSMARVEGGNDPTGQNRGRRPGCGVPEAAATVVPSLWRERVHGEEK